jgi:amino-acid N-acetyltransferase
MDTNVQIRTASDADLGAIESLLTENELPIVGVKDALPGFLVAESGGRLVGVVGLETRGRYGLLRSAAVAKEWRNRRIAKQLVERIIAAAESRGIHALYLLTTTAERYFPSFGFSVTTRDVVPDDLKTTDEFMDACPASATVMCLKLAS